jgi:hypothetical protein
LNEFVNRLPEKNCDYCKSFWRGFHKREKVEKNIRKLRDFRNPVNTGFSMGGGAKLQD